MYIDFEICVQKVKEVLFEENKIQDFDEAVFGSETFSNVTLKHFV